METEGLVESETVPGSHGPHRRVYRLGPRGEYRLREVLKDSIGNILHFYDAYRHSVTKDVYERVGKEVLEDISGRVLFAAFPRITQHDLSIAKIISSLCITHTMEVLGNTDVLKRAGIKHKPSKGDVCDIPTNNDIFKEIWLNGVPERALLPRAIAECKRVLVPGGRLRITAPYVFFDEPTQTNLGQFIRVTSSHLFPNLGIVEGQDVGSVIESNFQECGAFETFPNLVEFWAVKERVKI